MRKLANILFVFLYLQASVGVAINVHYCMGQFANAGVFVKSKGCICEDFEKKGKCCDDESYFYQLDDEQDFVKTTEVHAPFVLSATLPINHSVEKEIVSIKVNHELYDLPPPPSQPIWLMVCSPILYG